MTAADLDRHYAVNRRAVLLWCGRILCLEFMKGFTHAGGRAYYQPHRVVAFLASEAPGWGTGQVIRARGSS